MGQTLSSPATTKTSESGADGRFLYAVSEMQGWRITMEDAHAAVLKLDENSDEPNAFFAVYDGHGGGTVARFAGQNVHKRLVSEESYREKNYEEALKGAFLGTDEDLLADPAHARDPSGCTAVAALITDKKVYVANAGDSRSVLSVKGEVKPLSFDHKPTNDTERARITGAGGYIEYGRVNGNLALSRAIGDFDFKKNYNLIPEKQVITSNPDVSSHDIDGEDEFIVIACDGIWDCLSSQQVVDFVRLQVSEGKELSEIGEMMCDHCLAPDTSSGAGIGCDNMTVLILALLHGRTKEEWYAWIKDRVKEGHGYKTPSALPQLYSQSRLTAFRARQDAQAARDRSSFRDDDSSSSLPSFFSGTGINVTRILGSSGGISFQPGGSILGDNGTLMFTNDESDDEDNSDDDLNGSRTFFSEVLGLGRSDNSDPATTLKARIEEFEKDLRDEDGINEDVNSSSSELDVDGNEEAKSGKGDGSSNDTPMKEPHEETPPPPQNDQPLPNGDVKKAVTPIQQFTPTVGGDKADPVVQAEGLMDTSEDPTKTST